MRLERLSRQIARKAALVTGAASGMARATALLFAEVAACRSAATVIRVKGTVLVVDGGLTAQNT